MDVTLLTGGSGFIGKNLVRQFPNHNFRIVTRDHGFKYDNNKFYVNSINENTDWTGAFNDVNCIIHLAGVAHNKCLNITDYLKINYEGTINLAESAVKYKVKRFIFLSSIVAGLPSKYSKNQFSKYKILTEKKLLQIARTTGLEVVIIRAPLVYGLNAPANFSFLVKVIKFSPILPFGSVNNNRDLISVDNLCDLLVLCIEHPNATGQILNAADGNPISMKYLITRIAFNLDKRLYNVPVPISLLRFVFMLLKKENLSDSFLDDLVVDSYSAQNLLSWVPPFTMDNTLNKLKDTI
jgi:nucleoside-diphosphate-sugar epimerase